MITRALDAGVPAAWVAGDEVYGANPGLRAELEARQNGYVLAVACDYRVALVGVATPTPSTRPYLPLPATKRLATMRITIYGWRCATNVEGGSM